MTTSAQKRALYMALLAAYGVYLYALFALAAADAGPPRALDELEFTLTGRYWTLGSVALLGVPPFFALKAARHKLMQQDALDVATGWLSSKHDPVDLMWAGTFVVLAIGFSGVLFYRGAGGGEVQTLRALDVESVGFGDLSSGTPVEVHGFAAKKALKVTRIGAATHYVPLIGTKPHSKDDPPLTAEQAAAEAAAPHGPPSIVVDTQYENDDFEVDGTTGEVTARGVVESTPVAARIAGEKVGLVEDHPVLYVRAGSSKSRDIIAGVIVLIAGLGAAAAQLRKKKIASAFDQESARNEGAW